MPAISTEPFSEVLQLLAHRGPDGWGIWQEPSQKLTLGHRRLAILDLSEKGNQPMETERYVITFNGEIYNFLEIRSELQAKGYRFFSDTDTEVILAAFHEWREQCLLKFNGMWAFAVWDKAEHRLFLSRDRFGVKPLYYTFSGGRFAFASEMKALIPFLPELRVADNFDYLKANPFAYEATEQCLIAGIKRFPAGHYAYICPNENSLRPIRYWDTMQHLVQVPKRYEEQVEQFRELFTDACRIRMRADVPIGFTLSGGLDSSAIISTVVKKIAPKDNINAFVASLTGTFLDETPYALQVADDLHITADTVAIEPQKAWDLLEQQIYLFEELYLTAPSPMMLLYAAIGQKGVKVSIDGHGADELLSGYGHLTETLLDCGLRLWQVPDVLAAINGFSNLHTSQIGFKPYDWCYYVRFVASRFRHQPRELKRFLTRENPLQGKFGFLNKTLWRLFHQESLPVLLRNYDRYSMANGVESRMPFMDYRLVVYLFSVNWQSKVRRGTYKAILRDAMKGIVTEKVRLRQEKIGFNTPVIDWMRGAWREPLHDMMSDTAFNNAALIDAAAVRRSVMQVIDNASAKYSDGEQAWVALMPYLWERAVMRHQYPLID